MTPVGSKSSANHVHTSIFMARHQVELDQRLNATTLNATLDVAWHHHDKRVLFEARRCDEQESFGFLLTMRRAPSAQGATVTRTSTSRFCAPLLRRRWPPRELLLLGMPLTLLPSCVAAGCLELADLVLRWRRWPPSSMGSSSTVTSFLLAASAAGVCHAERIRM